MQWHTPEILQVPQWFAKEQARAGEVFATREARMRYAISLARKNIEAETGGPFGAAIFESATGKLLAPGANFVIASHWSGAHAEVVALALAQKKLETHDLASSHLPALELATSVEPCAMCIGAIHWSGIRQLICGATGNDAQAIGFDEGPKPEKWTSELDERGICVHLGVLQEESRQVLQAYAEKGGVVYNAERPIRSDQNRGSI